MSPYIWHPVYDLENGHTLSTLIDSPAIALNGAFQADSDSCQSSSPTISNDRSPQILLNNSRSIAQRSSQNDFEPRSWDSSFLPIESDVVGVGAWFEEDLLSVAQLDDLDWASNMGQSPAQIVHSPATETYKENIDSHGDCPHRCDQCPKSFKTLDELERHAKTSFHRVFSCPRADCAKRYYRRDSLARHKQVCFQKGNFKHVCSSCKRAFGRKDHLQQHMKNVHNQDWAPSSPKQVTASSLTYSSNNMTPNTCSNAVRSELSRLVQSLGNDPNAVQTLQTLLNQHQRSLTGDHDPQDAERPRKAICQR